MAKAAFGRRRVLALGLLASVFLFVGSSGWPGSAKAWGPLNFFMKDCFDRIEEAAKAKQECEVSQVLPGECDQVELNLSNAFLECRKQGHFDPASKERALAAAKLGRNKVPGSAEDSVYARVMLMLENPQLHIPPVPENFLLFSDRCGEIKPGAVLWGLGAVETVGDKELIVFYPVSHCINTDKVFFVLNEEQLIGFSAGRFFKEGAYPRHKKHGPGEWQYYLPSGFEVIRADSFDDGMRRIREMKRKETQN